MWENCPPRYLENELEVLRPRIILTMGIDAGNIAQHLPGFDQTDEADGFARGVATVAGTTVDVLRCRHPGRSERLWRASYTSLRESLERRPLSARA
jgi:uracil-DNA glycosylase